MTWMKKLLGDCVTLQRGHDLTSDQRRPGSVPVIGSAGQNGWHDTVRMRGPGLTVGRSGGSIGKVTYVEDDYWPHNTCLYARDLKGNNPRYLAALLQRLDLARLNSGSAQPSLNRNFVHAQKVLVPDVNIQTEIAATLSAYDDLIAVNTRRIALLEEAARLLYREWFVHLRFPGHEDPKKSGGRPEEWKMKAVSEVCKTIGGGTPSTTKPNLWSPSEVTWVTPTDVTNNEAITMIDTARQISKEGLAQSSAKMVPAKTILMTSRASVGFFGMMFEAVSTNQGFINIIPNDEKARYYLLFNMMERVNEIRSRAGGSTYKEISKSKFREMNILMPESSLLDSFHKIVDPIFETTLSLQKQNKALTRARDLLLPRLMDGRIELAS